MKLSGDDASSGIQPVFYLHRVMRCRNTVHQYTSFKEGGHSKLSTLLAAGQRGQRDHGLATSTTATAFDGERVARVCRLRDAWGLSVTDVGLSVQYRAHKMRIVGLYPHRSPHPAPDEQLIDKQLHCICLKCVRSTIDLQRARVGAMEPDSATSG